MSICVRGLGSKGLQILTLRLSIMLGILLHLLKQIWLPLLAKRVSLLLTKLATKVHLAQRSHRAKTIRTSLLPEVVMSILAAVGEK
ncbi:ORF969 [White spot syndrome virus]|uniref:ORF969 n=1 Tax=White spot syndrome virus TaxID=342409 RepID=A0A2D3I5W2_9VIRU|nr:ORF969 [White spot syndrome virus]